MSLAATVVDERGSWSPQLSAAQYVIMAHPARFKVVVAGRRFGKTYLSGCLLTNAAAQQPGVYFWVFPTVKQGKESGAWDLLKALTIGLWGEGPRESDRSIELYNGSRIVVHTAEDPDKLRGPGLSGIVLDEYADMRDWAWTHVFRPALSDHKGWAVFVGTPKGYNHFYDLFVDCPNRRGWQAFQFTTADGGNVDIDEIEDAARDQDERTHRQEYFATFESAEGRVYYAFERAANVTKSIEVDPGVPVYWSHDFNIALGKPMSSCFFQVREGLDRKGYARKEIHVFDELLQENTSVEEICKKVNEKPWWNSTLMWKITGDAAGKQRSAQNRQSCYDVLREGGFSSHLVPPANPPIRHRHRTLNSLCKSAAGDHRLFIHPRCKNLIKGLETVTMKEGNQLEEQETYEQHVTTALGYGAHQILPAGETPMRREVAEWR